MTKYNLLPCLLILLDKSIKLAADVVETDFPAFARSPEATYYITPDWRGDFHPKELCHMWSLRVLDLVDVSSVDMNFKCCAQSFSSSVVSYGRNGHFASSADMCRVTIWSLTMEASGGSITQRFSKSNKCLWNVLISLIHKFEHTLSSIENLQARTVTSWLCISLKFRESCVFGIGVSHTYTSWNNKHFNCLIVLYVKIIHFIVTFKHENAVRFKETCKFCGFSFPVTVKHLRHL